MLSDYMYIYIFIHIRDYIYDLFLHFLRHYIYLIIQRYSLTVENGLYIKSCSALKLFVKEQYYFTEGSDNISMFTYLKSNTCTL